MTHSYADRSRDSTPSKTNRIAFTRGKVPAIIAEKAKKRLALCFRTRKLLLIFPILALLFTPRPTPPPFFLLIIINNNNTTNLCWRTSRWGSWHFKKIVTAQADYASFERSVFQSWWRWGEKGWGRVAKSVERKLWRREKESEACRAAYI